MGFDLCFKKIIDVIGYEIVWKLIVLLFCLNILILFFELKVIGLVLLGCEIVVELVLLSFCFEFMMVMMVMKKEYRVVYNEF